MTMKTTASTQWIKKNMLGYYSEELNKSLTEAEVPFQQCTEQLPVPNWYRKYHKPYASKYCTPIDSRPSLCWKTLTSGDSKSSNAGSPKKNRSSPKSTPKKAQQDAEPPRTSSADSGFGDTFCLSQRTVKSSIDASESSFAPCSTSSPSPATSSASYSDVFESPKSSKNDVRAELDDSSNSVTTVRRRLNNSNTFPRISPSRKIEHINLVFSKPFPANQEPLTFEDVSNARFNRTIAGGYVQGIVNEINRSTGGTSGSPSTLTFSTRTRTISKASSTFVRSMVEALERTKSNVGGDSNIINDTYIAQSEEEGYSDDSTDSDLPKSTSISFKSYDSPDERTVTPLYSACIAEVVAEEQEEESEGDEEVYWAPCTLLELPCTSSRFSMASGVSNSAEARGVSLGLNPIKREQRPEDWLHVAQQIDSKTWNLADRSNERNSSRRLFRIDETDLEFSTAYVSASSIVV